MRKVILGTWQDKIIDNRHKEKHLINDEFPELEDFEGGNRIKAFVGWDGFFIFDLDVPVIDMMRPYV